MQRPSAKYWFVSASEARNTAIYMYTSQLAQVTFVRSIRPITRILCLFIHTGVTVYMALPASEGPGVGQMVVR